MCAVADETMAMRTLFRELELTSLKEGVATLHLRDPSYGSVAGSRREQIAEIFQRIVGAPIRVELGLPQAAPEQERGPIDDPVVDDPVVRQAKDLFGGTIVSVEVERGTD